MCDMQPEIAAWSTNATQLLASSLEIATGHFDRSERTFDQWLLRQLNVASHLTSETLLLIVAFGRLWDAEILARPIAEGSIKLAYIALAPEPERSQRAHDFYHVGVDLLHFTDDRKVRDFLSRVPDANDPKWRTYQDMLLSEDELARIQAEYSNKSRHEFADRWSFREMCEQLGRGGERFYDELAHATFGYTLNSHVLHRDAIGIGLLWDRVQRADEERAALELAHAARLISDTLSFTVARLYAISTNDPITRVAARSWWNDASTLLRDASQAYSKFHRAIYDEDASEPD